MQSDPDKERASMGVLCGGNADDTDAANLRDIHDANPAAAGILRREMVSTWGAGGAGPATPAGSSSAVLAAAPSYEEGAESKGLPAGARVAVIGGSAGAARFLAAVLEFARTGKAPR